MMALNDRDVAAAGFCLSKAFDYVKHEILVWKLESYGFRSTAIKWFESYLSGRVQTVLFGETTSESKIVITGVPQGSVLGPILCLLYTNDLADLDISGKFTLFADDATILWHTDDVNLLNALIIKDLTVIKQWRDANFLTLNASKTNGMSFKCNLGNVSIKTTPLVNLSANKF